MLDVGSDLHAVRLNMAVSVLRNRASFDLNI